MQVLADLHMHSNFSDGKYSIEYLIDGCIENNLNYFCISDHDTLEHIDAAKTYIKKLSTTSIELISGVEISANFNKNSIHILAYNIDENNPDLKELLNRGKTERLNSLIKMGDKLSSQGISLNYREHLMKQNSPGRPHLAELLIESGYCTDMQEAFDRWLGRGRPAYVKKWKPNAKNVIDTIHAAGGKAFIAHIGVYEFINSLSDILNLKIDGIEVFHPDHSSNYSIELLKFAEENKYNISGGSDFHGWNKNPRLGSFGLSEKYLDQFMDGLFL